MAEICCVRVSGDPLLNVGPEVVVDSSSGEGLAEYIIQCSGTQTLDWKWPETANKEYIKPYERYDPDELTYISTLKIERPDHSDTGYYTCYLHNEEDLPNQANDSTYIYFYDGKTNIVDGGFVELLGEVGHDIVLPCQTTHPDTKLSLLKDDTVKIQAPKMSWSSRVGFTLHNLREEDSGHYVCEASRDEFKILELNISEATTLLQPSITAPPNTHFVKGYPFQLECSVSTEHITKLKWTLPDGIQVTSGGNYHIAVLSLPENRNLRLRVTSILKVKSADQSGNYTCTVSAEGFQPVESNYHVEVMVSMESHDVDVMRHNSIIPDAEDVWEWFPQGPGTVQPFMTHDKQLIGGEK
ncbi:unnamed protein product, partial [Meganyctiphanes norvegica]